MRICSVTITSDTREDIIGDALRSVVDWVDACLVVHLVGGTEPPDRTMEIAREVCGDKLLVFEFSVQEEFVNMRNFGLDKATEASFDWAMQLDTDERIIVPRGVDVRTNLWKFPNDVTTLSVFDDTGTYDKFRFFRLPYPARFKYSWHEHLEPGGKLALMPDLRFHELPKTKVDAETYLKNMLSGLAFQSSAEPTNSRWHYYLGVAHEAIGQFDEAIEHFNKAAALDEDPKGVAWCYYRVASCQAAQGKHQQAMVTALSGLYYAPDRAELTYAAAQANLALGRYENAVALAKMAISQTWSGKNDAEVTHSGVKDPVALFEGPHEVLADSYRAIDLTELCHQEENETWKLKQERIAFFTGRS